MQSAQNASTVFIGFDSREEVCSHVASHSIVKRTKSPINIRHIKHREMRAMGIFSRPWLIEPLTGNYIDLVDTKPFSTEFSHTRFLVPLLMGYTGWALFMDADMIFLSDIEELFKLRDEKYAVMCVKHLHQPNENVAKMDGRLQLKYNRKNWSSFVLWNCGHPANKKLTQNVVNNMAGRDLHAFVWLSDQQIGSLPFSYNYISGVSPKFSLKDKPGNRPDVIHFTEGGPWFDSCQDVPYAPHWIEEYNDWNANGMGKKISSAPPSINDGDRIRIKND